MMNILQQPSPNFDDRAAGVDLTYIVLHYTGMKSGAEALARLTAATSKVSAHYMIEEDGRIFALVDEAKRAWHAGVSFWRGETDINSASIGIELVNPGHMHGYRPFPARQIDALKLLMQDIVKRRGMDSRRAVLAHADVAPGRKEDPGELFPWQELAEAGLGYWPKPEASDYGPASDAEVQRFLCRIGYECPDTSAYDLPTRNALIAFQRHFEPNNFTGTPERETIARMRALLLMMG